VQAVLVGVVVSMLPPTEAAGNAATSSAPFSFAAADTLVRNFGHVDLPVAGAVVAGAGFGGG
jgi:hypothetical protein